MMKSLGVIEEWSSPIALVLKKDGSIRFCIDFRKLNSQSNFDAYPTPRRDDLIERIGKALYISMLNLCRAYWQVPLAPEARQYTAFRTPQGLFQFTVMPFGLQGAPATFQRLMDQVLAGAGAFSASYLDDIIYSLTWEDHVQHLNQLHWKQRHEKAFMNLKEALCNDSVLQSPDFNQPFTVQTDASGVGLGAVLLQGEGDDQKPVAYVSRKLWPRDPVFSHRAGMPGNKVGFRDFQVLSSWERLHSAN